VLRCRFGVVLWELVTKEQPVRGRLVWPPNRSPPGLAKLFVACTNASPKARPTAQQLLSRLSGL